MRFRKTRLIGKHAVRDSLPRYAIFCMVPSSRQNVAMIRFGCGAAPMPKYRNIAVTAEAQVNVPGRAEGNWSWRCTEEMMSATDFDSPRELTKSSNRLGTLRRY